MPSDSLSPWKSAFFLLLFLVLLAPSSNAKTKSRDPLPPLPGGLRAGPAGVQIHLEAGRTLLWPERGALVLRDANNTVLSEVSLQAAAEKTSGAEAMGLIVEETDLGGSLSSKRKYLSGKKAPTGRRLAAGSVGGAPLPGGQEQKAVVEGVPMSWTQYPNGSSLWKIQWADREEELFFDRKKSLVHNQQTESRGPFTVVFKQFADGSYQRHFQRESGGEVQVVYDAGDRSYRIAFLNNQGETLAELDCRETCQ